MSNGNKSEKVLFYTYLNSFYETGFVNPIDEAIRSVNEFDLSKYNKLDEIPYDFTRKMLSILVSSDVCSYAETEYSKIIKLKKVKDKIQKVFKDYSSQGLRTIGIAYTP